MQRKNIEKEALQIIQRSLYCKDLGLYRHSLLTADIASHVVKNSGVNFGYTASQAYAAGILHDVGKLCVSSNILDKKESLTSREWEVVKRHPVWGYEYVQGTVLEEYGEVILLHHEKADGTGYPLLAKNENIADTVRLVALADQLAAFLDNRPYRRRITHFGLVCREIRVIAAGLFAGHVLDAIIVALRGFVVDWINKSRDERQAFSSQEVVLVQCLHPDDAKGCGHGSCQQMVPDGQAMLSSKIIPGLMANA